MPEPGTPSFDKEVGKPETPEAELARRQAEADFFRDSTHADHAKVTELGERVQQTRPSAIEASRGGSLMERIARNKEARKEGDQKAA